MAYIVMAAANLLLHSSVYIVMAYTVMAYFCIRRSWPQLRNVALVRGRRCAVPRIRRRLASASPTGMPSETRIGIADRHA